MQGLDLQHVETAGGAVSKARPRVLVVDDEPLTRGIVGAKVRSMGAEVVEAGDGEAALACIKEGQFDLAIVDLDMPKMNGIDLIQSVRLKLLKKHLPIVVLTGNEVKSALDAALFAGATSFLQKPLNWACFGPHIRHLLRI